MWKLTPASKELKNWYASEMLDGLYRRIKKSNSKKHPDIDNRIREILIPKNHKGKDDLSILRRLLTDKPKSLYKLCDSLMKKIIDGYDDSEFNNYLIAKKKKKNKNDNEIYSKYHDVLNRLLRMFDYQGQISRNKSRAYKLTSEQGRNTCTYCNRQYTFTVIEKKSKNNSSKTGKDSDKIVRPELDHWFSKELYPLMSLSIHNLIPSCSMCNGSSAKGNKIFSLNTYIHPYLSSTPDEPQFKFKHKLYKDEDNHECCDVMIDEVPNKKVENMLNAFNLRKIYKYHGELEVRDILLFKYKNPSAHLKYLLDDLLKGYKLNEESVYRMLFGTELVAKNDLNRPLSKLKRDILKQIGLLKDGELIESNFTKP